MCTLQNLFSFLANHTCLASFETYVQQRNQQLFFEMALGFSSSHYFYNVTRVIMAEYYMPEGTSKEVGDVPDANMNRGYEFKYGESQNTWRRNSWRNEDKESASDCDQ